MIPVRVPTEAERARMEAEAQRRAGATHQATSPRLAVGWSVYQVAPAGSDYWPRGGVVAHVDRLPDPETGELVDRYLLVRASRGHLVWVSLGADQLAIGSAKPPNAHTIRGVCQVAARELAATERARRPDDTRALELWSLGTRLMAGLASHRRGNVPHSLL